jgi:tetratricopeptide (TPR) repeat protein
MTRKTSSKSAMGTRLEEVLTQKQVPPAAGHEALQRIRNLESEFALLRADNARLESENEYLKTLAGEGSGDFLPNPDTLFSRGVAALKAEDALEAIVLLRMVLAMRPGHTKARLNLAVGYYLLGYTNLAIGSLREVLNQDPENPVALQNLALITSPGQNGSP